MAVGILNLTSFCLWTSYDLKANLQVEETAPGVATGMILSLRERYCFSYYNICTYS